MLDGLRRTPRYHFLSALGEGAVGRVERVFDAQLGRAVARKTLRDEVRDDEHAVRTFVNEARILAHLDHGAVLPIFDVYLDDTGAPVYTMREISGRSLSRLLQIERFSGDAIPISLERTLKIVRQLCEALAHAHERGVLHLDMKPENIIVLEHDEVVVVDWGAARLFAPDRYRGKLAEVPELSAFVEIEDDDELLVGTPRYMSPEQTIARRSELGPQSDIFSLGVIFYQMLTGRLPFQGEGLEAVMVAIREAEPTEPRSFDRGIHPRLSAIVMRMIAKPEYERYEDFGEVIRDLDAFRSTAAEFPLQEFAAGDVLFREGDDGDFALVIVSGEVEIWTEIGGRKQVLGRHIEGEAVGELALLRDMPRSASATALTPTQVRRISPEALTSQVETLNPWALAILSGVVERFIDRSERLVELLRAEGAEDEAR